MNSDSESLTESLISSEEEIGYGRIAQILLRRWPWVMGALGVSVLASAILAITKEPIYVSSMQLVVEPNYETGIDIDLKNLNSSSGRQIDDIDYATQLNIMRSEQFLVEALSGMSSKYRDITIPYVKENFSLDRVVEKDTETRIFEATFQSDDPVLTQQFLEELKNVYLSYNESQQSERLNRGLEFINNQLNSTRTSLSVSQAALEEFRENASTIDPSSQAQQISAALDDVAAQKRQLQSDLADAQARYQFLIQQTGLSPETALVASRLTQSEQIQTLLQQLQTTELELAERRNVFTDADPTVRLLAERLQTQQELLQETVSEIIRTPADNLNSNFLSYSQLGEVDLALVSDLLLTRSSLQGLLASSERLTEFENQLRSQLNTFPGLIAEFDRLQPEVEIERETLQRLLEEREQLTSEIAKGGYVWQVVDEPSLGTETGAGPTQIILLGIVVGLFLGGSLAFGREMTDTSIHSQEDLKKIVPFPVLGDLPKLKLQPIPVKFQSMAKASSAPREEVITSGSHIFPTHTNIFPTHANSDLVNSFSKTEFRESVDAISNQIHARHHQENQKLIAVVSTLSNEGKTSVTLALAYSLSRMGKRVLVIDTDLRRSVLSDTFAIDRQQGLCKFLVDKTKFPVFQTLDFGNSKFDLLPAGDSSEDPIILLSSERFQQLVKESCEQYDFILFDTPPLLGVADAIKICTIAQSLVFVARLHYVTKPYLNEVISLLKLFNVLGVIANASDRPAVKSYYQ